MARPLRVERQTREYSEEKGDLFENLESGVMLRSDPTFQ